MDRWILFAGGPDTVYRLIMEFADPSRPLRPSRDGRAVRLHEEPEAEKGIRLVSKEVRPRRKEIAPRCLEAGGIAGRSGRVRLLVHGTVLVLHQV